MRKQAPSHNAGVGPRSRHFPLDQSPLSPPSQRPLCGSAGPGLPFSYSEKKKEGGQENKDEGVRVSPGPGPERQGSLGQIHLAACFFLIAAGSEVRGRDTTSETPVRSWEAAGHFVPVLNLLSISAWFQNMQTYLKQRHFTGRQVS